MPVNMTLAALLMSGAVQPGEPLTKITLDAEAVSQPNGGAGLVLVQGRPLKKTGKKQEAVRRRENIDGEVLPARNLKSVE